MKNEHSIGLLCQAFEVSKSGYYQWRFRQREPAQRRVQDRELGQEIHRLHQESRATYGAPRIQARLRELGQRHGRNRIGRLMREQQLCGRQKGRYRVVTTDSNHDQPIAPNRLADLPAPSGPNQTWLADITYIQTAQGWLYLAAILDLYSRKIVGWAASERIDTALVLAAWNMALCHRQPPAGLVFHSDRGVQYASRPYRWALQVAQAIASMSRQANCYDNAAMEAFWSTLKMELIYRRKEAFATREEARAALFDYIEIFYNRQRLHSALGYQTPAAFECARN
jgi:transposase InsO family protein